jgi:hypothetical protein
MTDGVVLYTHPKTKRMAIFTPSPRSRLPGESEADWLARCIARALPGATDIRITTRAEVPTDRTFRDAWVLRNGRPQVDMAKARDLHRYRIRRKRKAFFRDLDARQLRAVVAGQSDVVANIETAKQALREAPDDPGIDAAQTPEQLKAVWPLPSA